MAQREFKDLPEELKQRFRQLVNNHGLAGYYKFCIEQDEGWQKSLDEACKKPNPWLDKVKKDVW